MPVVLPEGTDGHMNQLGKVWRTDGRVWESEESYMATVWPCGTNGERLTKKIYESAVEGKRRRSRPKMKWRDGWRRT